MACEFAESRNVIRLIRFISRFAGQVVCHITTLTGFGDTGYHKWGFIYNVGYMTFVGFDTNYYH